MKKFILFAVFCLFLAGCTTPYSKVEGDPLDARIYTLDNGLRVYLSVNKDEPRIQTFIAVRVGGKDDPADNTGLAHYLEHMMFKGTQLFGTRDYGAEKPMLDQIDSLFEIYRCLNDPAERAACYSLIDSISYEASKLAIPNEYDKLMSIIGSEGSNAFTSNDVTCYVEEIPSNRIEDWAKIEADRFMNCVFRGFHTELEAVYEEKNMSLTSDDEKALDAIDAMLFPSHPYGTQTVIGTQDHLKNPSLRAIRLQKDRYYVPNNVAICMSGDLNPEKTIRIIKKHFSGWKPNPELPVRESVPVVSAQGSPVRDVWGNDAQFAMLGWRTPGASDTESEISELAGAILYNGTAGLIDLNLVQRQAILDAAAFPYNRAEGGLFLLEGMAKEGQSLSEVASLLRQQVAKLREGDFPDELLEAAKANWKLGYMNSLTGNRSRANFFLDAFVNGQDWETACGKAARIEAVSKDDIVAWAGKYLADESCATVYKHEGEDPDIKKIEAPKITPIVTNREFQSDFLASVAASKPREIKPVFVNWNKDMSVGEAGELELLYKKNEKNDIATLMFRYDRGSDNDPLLPIAAGYLEYLGSDRMSADEYASRMYRLACNADIRVGGNTTVLSISGLDENLEEALSLMEYQLDNVVPDELILSELKADMLRARADAMKNQRACSSALQTYLTYGPEYVAAKTLKNVEVKALESADILDAIQSLLACSHTVLYYGPATEEEVVDRLERVHQCEGLLPLEKTHPEKLLTPSPRVLVAHYDARQFNYVQYSDRGEKLDLSQDPQTELFNEYYGGGMNAIVFQEMRESRALAYGAGAWLSGPAFKDDSYSFRAYIASQNDKLQKAVEAFDEIIETLPQAPENLEIAKAALLGKLRTQRTIGPAVLQSYLNARELGISEPREKLVFEKLSSLDMDDLVATHERWIKGRSYWYAILGDTKDLDMEFLKTLGPVEQLPLEEVFGY